MFINAPMTSFTWMQTTGKKLNSIIASLIVDVWQGVGSGQSGIEDTGMIDGHLGTPRTIFMRYLNPLHASY